MKSDLNKIAKVLKGRTGRMLCLVFSIIFVTGCVTTEETNRMQYQINTLRAEVKKITRKSKSIETQFPGQQKQFNEKVQELEEAQQAAAKTVSDLLIRIQYLATEVQMLTGRLEEARYHSEKNSSELKENKEMLSAKMKQLDTMVEDLKKRLAGPAPVAAPKEEPGKTEAAAEHKDDNNVKEVKKESDPEAAIEKEKADVKDAYMAAYEAYKEDRTV